MKATPAPTIAAEPFLKWAGGKRALLPQILGKLPEVREDARYFEPFLGGGAVFFELCPPRATLSDLNGALIATYRAIRDCLDEVVSVLVGLENARDEYYRIRAWRPRTPARQAARFIYLNKTCFNGLYRENLRGEFNVPYGRHRYQTVVCDVDQLTAASKALQGKRLRTQDFVRAVTDAKEGDVVYFDPPYITAHLTNGFVEYNARVFSWADQQRLRDTAVRLAARGTQVVISNADHPSIRRLYARNERLQIHTLRRWSTVASRAAHRYRTTELLITTRERS